MSNQGSRKRPLSGLRVLDFSNLLPGPYATLILVEAGAEVFKIERPEGGDELRAATPRWGESSLNFALLNGGKRSIAIDLKSPAERERLLPLLREADILVEQFRPGVMERLGLGYEALRVINPRLIYCSITGYGQDGPLSQVAGHDLTYMAETGLLSLSKGADGAPILPPVLVADIGGGTMPAVINILLALRHRDLSGEGSHIDVSITDNLFAFPYSALARGVGFDQWPRSGQERLTGATPRYQIYRTSDARHVAAAPLEQRFWRVFCETIGLDPAWRDDGRDPEGTREAIAALIARHDSAYWRRAFDGKDACAVVVNSMEEAAAHPHFRGHGLLERRISEGGRSAAAVRVPLDAQFVRNDADQACPALGEGNHLLGG
ncbi:CaiB/BaiF CoA transferase family protein [Noviherbaspirillum suwonense]|uniref:Crotonobetainyl-CoA:carnitine CoA-transferase CaiB n=1 Tax=Noviherbaspirillum suwonense TaxID=1224511 RepID=A0ABY1QVA0_9BURK|nr:CaiB/BaiF CoA-transferase family protein [Noviherbaspirillum suwonense]SMP81793.1 Crotonobetainyl-CoA:carnitine CoA-transferase CaiB [Noviherbaspirillum suwonense]